MSSFIDRLRKDAQDKVTPPPSLPPLPPPPATPVGLIAQFPIEFVRGEDEMPGSVRVARWMERIRRQGNLTREWLPLRVTMRNVPWDGVDDSMSEARGWVFEAVDDLRWTVFVMQWSVVFRAFVGYHDDHATFVPVSQTHTDAT